MQCLWQSRLLNGHDFHPKRLQRIEVWNAPMTINKSQGQKHRVSMHQQLPIGHTNAPMLTNDLPAGVNKSPWMKKENGRYHGQHSELIRESQCIMNLHEAGFPSTCSLMACYAGKRHKKLETETKTFIGQSTFISIKTSFEGTNWNTKIWTPETKACSPRCFVTEWKQWLVCCRQ